MRLNVLLGLMPLVIAGLARAQPAAESAPEVRCTDESDCTDSAACLSGFCAPRSTAPINTYKGFSQRLTLSIGLSTFGEVFPVSTAKVPGTSRGQFSLLAGLRFAIGTRLPSWFRVLVVIEAGYTSAGYLPTRAADGVMEGAGLEISLDRYKRVQPFIRFMYCAVVVPLRTTGEGTLAYNAYFFDAGVRINIFEINLSIGRDFAGGIAPGIGLGVGWLH